MSNTQHNHHFIHYLLLIIGLSFGLNSNAQQNGSRDIGLDYPVKYSAYDSIVADIPNQIVRLYGSANVQYDDVVLDAELIEIDLNNNEVSATYGIDSLGNPIGKPVFVQGGEEIKCETIKYNFDTKQGYITEVRTQQGDGYIHMAESKIHPNEEIHLKNGKYTSCDAEKPHYHFQLSKAIVVPEKRVVTGPLYMRLFNVPLPLAAPFAVLPNSESRKHGIIIPEFALAGKYGSGFANLGYYFPINQSWETYAYATLYTTGVWGLRNQTNYYKKYKYKGSFTLSYEHLKGYFYEDLNTSNYIVKWQHSQDAKAHPSIKFNSDINFVSNNPQNSINVIGENYFNSQLNSSMNVTKRWKLSQLNGSWTAKTSLRQNKSTNSYNIDLPSFNLNVSRFDLGILRKSKVGKKWYENITMTYAMNSANTINAPDSIFTPTEYNQIKDYALNGIKQNAVLQTNLKPKTGWFNFNLTTNFTELWNFQTYQKDWNSALNKVDTTFVNGFKSTRNINFSGGLSANLYGYYKSPKQNVKARHVMSPSINFTYKPDLGAHQFYIDSTLNKLYYSPFDVSLYREVARGESGLISFNLANTLELKTRDKSDSVNTTYKLKRLVDAFNIGGSYDIFKDSMKLSDFTFSFRTTPIKNINLQAGWRLSPYAWDDLTGVIQKDYAWTDNKGIGRITTANMAIRTNLKKIKTTKKDTTTNPLKPDWSLNISYNIRYDRTQTGIIQQDTFKLTQTIGFDGKLNLGTKWKFIYGLNYDIQNFDYVSPMNGISQLKYSIWRDLHCWEAMLSWSQAGAGHWYKEPGTGVGTPLQKWDRPTNYVWTLRVNIKSSMFDAFLPSQNLRIPKNVW